jgi:hypothetical protein
MAKITTVKGFLTAYGESTLDQRSGNKRYSYISITDEDGDEVYIKKVTVPQDVDRLITTGDNVTIVVAKNIFGREIHSARVGTREAHSKFIEGNWGVIYAACIGLLICGLVLSFIIIGIPIVLIAIYAMVTLPGTRRKIIAAAKAEGMTMKKAKRI